MINYGLKAATKDIDVLLSICEETADLVQALLKSGYHLISKEDVFLFKTVTEREDDKADLLHLARVKVDWELVLRECMSQSRADLRCEVDLFDKLDRLRASYGLETPIYGRISQTARTGMENWFEEQIIEELKMSPRAMEELLERFEIGRETLMPSLVNLEKMGRIRKVSGKYKLHTAAD